MGFLSRQGSGISRTLVEKYPEEEIKKRWGRHAFLVSILKGQKTHEASRHLRRLKNEARHEEKKRKQRLWR